MNPTAGSLLQPTSDTMKALLLGSFIALGALTTCAQSGVQEKVTIQFETDRPEVIVTSATGEKRMLDLKVLDGQKGGDYLSSALAAVKEYGSTGWTLIGSESCTGVSSSH
jgi:hypothetical protein